MSKKILEAPFGRKNALDAPKDGSALDRPVCKICGEPSERKRRPNGTWFYYSKCRRCRRLPSHTLLLGNSIADDRLASLVFALYSHLLELKKGGWKRTPKSRALHGLSVMLGVLKDD